MLLGGFQKPRQRVEGELNGTKYQDNDHENLVQSIHSPTGTQAPKHTAKTMQKWLMDNSVNVL